jgi:hypothetical protein
MILKVKIEVEIDIKADAQFTQEELLELASNVDLGIRRELGDNDIVPTKRYDSEVQLIRVTPVISTGGTHD